MMGRFVGPLLGVATAVGVVGKSFANISRAVAPSPGPSAQPEGSVVVVAHGNAIGMLLGALLDMPYSAAWRFRLENTGVTTVQDFDGAPVLMSLNDTAHLSGLE